MLSPVESAETSREDAVIFRHGLAREDMQQLGRVLLRKSRKLIDAKAVVFRLSTLRASPALVVDPFVSVVITKPPSNTCARDSVRQAQVPEQQELRLAPHRVGQAEPTPARSQGVHP